MPYYLVQATYHPASVAAMIQSPQDRPRTIAAILNGLGGSLEGFWLAFGEYDVAAICLMPNDVSMAAFSLAVSAGGGVKAIKTTPLLRWEEASLAMQQAGGIGYSPPSRPPADQSIG